MVRPTVDIVLPVYWRNVPQLTSTVEHLLSYFRKHLTDYSWTIVLSANGAHAEKLLHLAKTLSRRSRHVTFLYTPHSGKGHGVLHAWEQSTADICAYMDADLATDLRSVRPLLRTISDGADLAVGSRYHPDSRIQRGLLRLLISKVYLLLFYHLLLGVPYRDAQCGFKAIRHSAVPSLVPLVQDRGFFFESELLYHAYTKGYRIVEVPIVWREGTFSSVNMIKVIPNFIRNVFRLRFRSR